MSGVYEGGLPTGGFSTNLSDSNEGETTGVPGKSEAKNPSVVNQGGSGGGKSYDETASESFLMDSSYKTDMEIGRPGKMDIDNPDDISHADHNDDEDRSY